MFGRLKSVYAKNQIKKIFDKADVNSTQKQIKFNQIVNGKFFEYFESEETKILIIDEFMHGINSKYWVQKLKYYMTIHFYILGTQDLQLRQKFLTHQLQIKQKLRNQFKVQDIEEWINDNLIQSYHSYILKLCMNVDLMGMCLTTSQNLKFEDEQNFDLINNGFKALNFINFILSTYSNFNKLGRYYPQFKVIVQFYKMYLQDMKVFYHYVKNIIHFVLAQYKKFNHQQLKHAFTFLNDALNTSDNMYEFFYNKYFCCSMKDFKFPSIYKLDYKSYQKFVKYSRRKNICIVVPSMKQQIKHYLNQTCQTQNNENIENFQKTNNDFVKNGNKQSLQTDFS